MSERHANLKVLNDWCNRTEMLHLWVNFQNRTGDWAVRVLTHARGKAHPLRTCIGSDLESLCAEILPKAQQTFEQQRASIEREFKAWERKQTYDHHRETREIEAMHHTAADY